MPNLTMIAKMAQQLAETVATGMSHGGGRRKTAAMPATIAMQLEIYGRVIGRSLTPKLSGRAGRNA